MAALRSVELELPPHELKVEFDTLFNDQSLRFLAELVSTFEEEVEQILNQRIARKVHLDLTGELPNFSEDAAHILSDKSWRVHPVPKRLQRRHVDIGDLAPCNTERFKLGLSSPAQGIQVDFDDGNCPTYYNQIKGLYNVYKVVHNQFPDVPPISQAPLLMLRPRAWNMVEHNMMVNGKEVPGPLFDFGLLMFHNGKLLLQNDSGPFFYLSKIECYKEARLWNKIFLWAEKKLDLPFGCIKATVLIENILATFEMEEILYELRQHSAGLNCGIWDYSASFVNKFGRRPAFLLPDRSKYVNMEKRFLKSYMDLLVQTCHRRGALATGGMAAQLLPRGKDSAPYRRVLATVTRLKLLEIQAGVDGFMVYDLDLIEPMQRLFQMHTSGENQLLVLRDDVSVTSADLLAMPAGGVTLYGLKYNIAVGILFIEAWLTAWKLGGSKNMNWLLVPKERIGKHFPPLLAHDSWCRLQANCDPVLGRGHFFYQGQVEDSATAEISRSQVWQWIRHRARLEDEERVVTRGLVRSLVQELLRELKVHRRRDFRGTETLLTAAHMFLEVVQKSEFPEFLTTYLNLDHAFLSSQDAYRQLEETDSLNHKL